MIQIDLTALARSDEVTLSHLPALASVYCFMLSALFHLLSKLYARARFVIPTNLSISELAPVFGDATPK